MKKITKSLLVIGVVALVAFGASQAFFSDTEESTNNVLQAGAIDLLIDNTSYYNGVLNRETSWRLTDLEDELFFNFEDLKPGDWGEDTISIHVNDNDSWVCAEVTLTADNEMSLTEPEADLGDLPDDPNNRFDGELAREINFAWWADDGDNVYEDDETIISQGPLGAAPQNESIIIPLADAQTDIWNLQGPFPGGETKYVAKAWCFGEFEFSPEPQDGQGLTQSIGGNGPDVRNAGISCNGAPVSNWSQTDAAYLNVGFYAVQSRNNLEFTCESLNAPEIVVEEGSVDFSESLGGRWRSFGNTGGNELYVGLSDLGVGGNRSEAGFTWSSPGDHDVELSYDSGTNTLTAKVDGTETDRVTTLGCTPDAMQMSIVARDDDTTVALNGAMLDGNALGSWSADGNSNDWLNYNVTGFDFSGDWTWTGEISLDGSFGSSQELSKVEVLVGCEA